MSVGDSAWAVVAERLDAESSRRERRLRRALSLADCAALAWALPILDDLVARNAERAEDVHHRHKDAAYARMAAVAVERLAMVDLHAASQTLAECEVDDVRRAVLGTIRLHGEPGVADYLTERAAVR